MKVFTYYLIIINIVGLALFASGTRIHAGRAKNAMEKVLIIVSLLGGALGILVSILIFDRRITKDNILSRIIFACVFVIQAAALLFLSGSHADKITLAFWEYFAGHRLLLLGLCLINAVAFILFAVDKLSAVKNRRRVPIVLLLGLCFFGGSMGGLAAMYLFRHKTQKKYFTLGLPLMLAMQCVILFCLMNM